jgi:murein DD-endopeptidase MepM/ murein hydrolase activator NlpD
MPRDLEKEKSYLKQFGEETGKMPSTEGDWKAFHTMVYGKDLPQELGSLPMYSSGAAPETTTPEIQSDGATYMGQDVSNVALDEARKGYEPYENTGKDFMSRVQERIKTKFKPESSTLGIGSFSATLGALDPTGTMNAITEKSNEFRKKGSLALQALTTAGGLFDEQAKRSYDKLERLEGLRKDYETEQNAFETEAKNLALTLAQSGTEIPADLLNLLPQKWKEVYKGLPSLIRATQDQAPPTIKEIDGITYQWDKESGDWVQFSEVQYQGELDDFETQKQYNTLMGDGVVSTFGSKLWKPGVDFVLNGGQGAPIGSPVSGTVTSVVDQYSNTTGKPLSKEEGLSQNGGFGNQIKIETDDGQEFWISHMDSIGGYEDKEKQMSRKLQVGDSISVGQIVGSQGNTGATYGGNGVHVDFTGINADKTKMTAREAMGVLSGITPTTAAGNLTIEQKLQSAKIAKTIFGVRGASKPENLKMVTDLMNAGYTTDKIQDMLKYSGQSELMTDQFRDATTSITTSPKFSAAEAEGIMDGIDRMLENGNINGAKEMLKKSAIDSFGETESKVYRGKERLLAMVNAIESDLVEYQNAGGNTNLFTGTNEKVMGKIGEISDPDVAFIATKIQMAVQSYRQAISGAAFTESESKEYQDIFPSTSKTSDLNAAKIKALKEMTNTELDWVYQNRMGTDAYNEIFMNSGEYSLIAPDGTNLVFPTQEALDKFKKDFNLE